MKIKSIIIDDEKNSRENLYGVLNKYFTNIEILACEDSVNSGIIAITKYKPDLVFLDIEMPHKNGFDLLEYYQEMSFEVIFVTAYDHYALRAIKFSALDYILKPININELTKAIKKMEKKLIQKEKNLNIDTFINNLKVPLQEKKIALPNATGIEFISVNKITRCEGEGNYSKIFLNEAKSILVSKTLFEFEELLEEYNFLRVHKTHLINLSYLKAFINNNGYYIILTDGSQIPVSRRKKEAVLKTLNNFCK